MMGGIGTKWWYLGGKTNNSSIPVGFREIRIMDTENKSCASPLYFTCLHFL